MLFGGVGPPPVCLEKQSLEGNKGNIWPWETHFSRDPFMPCFLSTSYGLTKQEKAVPWYWASEKAGGRDDEEPKPGSEASRGKEKGTGGGRSRAWDWEGDQGMGEESCTGAGTRGPGRVS